jgi:haloacetate dehalogenase
VIPGFREHRVRVSTDPEIDIVAHVGGSGPPVLLLHGYPQCHVMWHRVAPLLADGFTVVAADLRGYGESSAPPDDAAHSVYSKRAMAADQVALMRALGFDRFAVVGHDRGARVAHRMALDHAQAVERVAVLDIVPTRTLLHETDLAFATAYYHWFFLIQPDGLPERMIGADPEWFLRETLRRWSAFPERLAPDAVDEYVRRFTAATIAASCADYRAATTSDLELDDADAADGRRVTQPLQALWGVHGAMGRMYDVLETWRAVAGDVRGAALPGGHFIAEECHAECAAALLDFLS